MDFADYLRRQFAYNAWANQEVLAGMRASEGDVRSRQLMGHILAAESLWLERIRQQPQALPVWPTLAMEECGAFAVEMASRWRDFLATKPDLSQTISYKNSKGEPWQSTVLDVLTHVLTHSAYHRGQIASHTRQSGKTPAYTDFIHAVRQGLIA